MIKQITKPFIWIWEKIKQGGRWAKKKWKWILGIFTGVVMAAPLLFAPATFPAVEVNGVVIEFPYTDDNANENLLIYTDKETYSNGEYIYLAIKNEGVYGLANLQFFFKGSTEITEVKRLVLNSPYQIETPKYKTVKYDCDYFASSTNEWVEQTCEKEEVEEYKTEIRYKDTWFDQEIADFSKEENDLLVKKIKEKPKANTKALKKTQVNLVDDFTYFRAKIKAPMRIDEEFFVEVIGDDIYGHLDPFLDGWDLRIQFDVPPTNIDASLDWFPLTLHIGTSTGITAADVTAIFDEVGANSKKIAITEADEQTQIYVEIEEWDSGGEQAWLHSSAASSTISHTATTTFYLYYDNDHADNTTYVATSSNRTEVWDDNFMAVHHLSEASGTFLDSTSNNVDSVELDITTYNVEGRVGGAPDFELTNTDYIAFGDIDAMDGMDGYTNECWIKPEELNSTMRMANKEDVFYSWTDNVPQIGHGLHGVSPNTYASTTPQVDTWYYQVGTWHQDIDRHRIYVDGEQDGTEISDGDDMYSDPHHYSIGARHNAGTSWVGWFDGIIDEVRISNTNRSAAWIKASYHSQNDSLISWGSEETPVQPSVALPMEVNIIIEN